MIERSDPTSDDPSSTMSTIKKKILVTDDDPEIQKVVTRALRRFGFEVVCASHGLEAIQLAHTEGPDLILMDLNMPGLHGEDVYQELRSQFKTRTTPIIFITAQTGKEDVAHGFAIGVDDYICKPFHIEDLITKINSSLRRALILRDANPVTKLPGENSINKEILRRLDRKEPFSVLYAGLNEFKTYVERYDVAAGNALIEITGRIFEEMAGEKNTLIGHLGGDEFVIVTDADDVKVLCENILRTFDYMAQPVALGIGVVNVDSPDKWSLATIHATGAEVKKAAQAKQKSAIAFIDDSKIYSYGTDKKTDDGTGSIF